MNSLSEIIFDDTYRFFYHDCIVPQQGIITKDHTNLVTQKSFICDTVWNALRWYCQPGNEQDVSRAMRHP